jgi:hypothetical protein
MTPRDRICDAAPQMKEVDAEDLRIDLRSDKAIRWLNDIETGRQYWHWTRNLASLLQPMFPGQLHRVQRNLYSTVGLIDPASAHGLQCAHSSFKPHLISPYSP